MKDSKWTPLIKVSKDGITEKENHLLKEDFRPLRLDVGQAGGNL